MAPRGMPGFCLTAFARIEARESHVFVGVAASLFRMSSSADMTARFRSRQFSWRGIEGNAYKACGLEENYSQRAFRQSLGSVRVRKAYTAQCSEKV